VTGDKLLLEIDGDPVEFFSQASALTRGVGYFYETHRIWTEDHHSGAFFGQIFDDEGQYVM